MTAEERLERLEHQWTATRRRNRWLLVALLLTGGGLFLAWTLTKAAPTASAQRPAAVFKVVRANAFVLEDANGNPRALLHMDKGWPGLGLYDEKRDCRVGLCMSKHGGGLTLSDEKGQGRAGLILSKTGAGLSLADENGDIRALLTVLKVGPRLALLDEKGKIIWSAPPSR